MDLSKELTYIMMEIDRLEKEIKKNELRLKRYKDTDDTQPYAYVICLIIFSHLINALCRTKRVRVDINAEMNVEKEEDKEIAQEQSDKHMEVEKKENDDDRLKEKSDKANDEKKKETEKEIPWWRGEKGTWSTLVCSLSHQLLE